MTRKLWQMPRADRNVAGRLAGECGVSSVLTYILAGRGIDTPEAVRDFLSEGEISDPGLLTDIDKAVERINTAIDSGEKILVYGDYDADGITATALLYSVLLDLGADVTRDIPSRFDDGYGLSDAVCDRAAQADIRLVITVDNGISAVSTAEKLASLGIDLVITDHHIPSDELPQACAVVDPYRADDKSPFKPLAGVGVAMKLAAALIDGDMASVIENYADLAAIGTIADVMPCTGENRIIIKRGLELINSSNVRPGLAALKSVLGFDGKELRASDIAYLISPRINAFGRIGDADAALSLMLCEDEDGARELASQTESANAGRRECEDSILRDIGEYFTANPQRKYDDVIVIAGHDWPVGVIGLAAARVMERFGRPCAVISTGDDGTARGSCRSIEGFSMYDALSSVSSMLLAFGGHELAAGFSVMNDRIDEFRTAINEFALSHGRVFPRIDLDVRIKPEQINLGIVDTISALEPFGKGNPQPVFGIFGMTITGITPVSSGRHTRLDLGRGGARIRAMLFGVPTDKFYYRTGDCVDLAVTLARNEFHGTASATVRVMDIRPAGKGGRAYFESLALYDRYRSGAPLSARERQSLCPDRSLITDIYRSLRADSFRGAPENLLLRVDRPDDCAGRALVAQDALMELGLIDEAPDGTVSVRKDPPKVDLGRSSVLSSLGYAV